MSLIVREHVCSRGELSARSLVPRWDKAIAAPRGLLAQNRLAASSSQRRSTAILRCSNGDDAVSSTAVAARAEGEVPGMKAFLDTLKYNKDGHVAVIVQHVDTGEVLMQAFADRAALSETLQTRLATFFSRSQGGRWCKGETSGNFIRVLNVYPDCDRDSIIYMGEPIGPACHTGARTCWFSDVSTSSGHVNEAGSSGSRSHAPATTLYALESTIQQRKEEALADTTGGKPSWTARLLQDPQLLCKKVREEAGELCLTLEEGEGKERAASEMADLLYHSMVLLNLQGVAMEDVLRVLRGRFGTSGVEEKAARPPKGAMPDSEAGKVGVA